MPTVQECGLAKRAWEERLFRYAGVQSVGVGFRESQGKRTGEICIVVSVRQKLPLSTLRPSEVIPHILGVPSENLSVQTDVQECGERKALELSTKERPCPGGWSVGHKDVTAGTLGLYVRRGAADGLYILSNNHVLANTNEASPGDTILQPGKYDGGTPDDRIATLTEFVVINFPGKKDKKRVAKWFWKAAKAIPNAVAVLARCDNRLVLREGGRVSQPDPNLVDAAIALVADPSFSDERIGRELLTVDGIRDLRLGDRVFKWGRTTERTVGYVSSVDVSTRVNYGGGKVTKFQDQLDIKADSDEFSAGGDSGSAILSEDEYLGGLLFAGGTGVTVANKISNVVSLLGIRL